MPVILSREVFTGISGASLLNDGDWLRSHATPIRENGGVIPEMMPGRALNGDAVKMLREVHNVFVNLRGGATSLTPGDDGRLRTRRM
jgi:hypothetical protein